MSRKAKTITNPYITEDYFVDVYLGQPNDDFDRLSRRASDQIDIMTNYKITFVKEDETFVVDQVKKATAAMVEFYLSFGGYDRFISRNEDDADIGDFSIGDFRYKTEKRMSFAGSQSQSKEEQFGIPDIIIQLLMPTGLLHAGVSMQNG